MTTPSDAASGEASMRVFVNERGVDVPRGASALDAVRRLDADEADRVVAGERAMVDSRGLPADPHGPAFAGAIYRTITARRPADVDTRAPGGADDTE